MGATEQKVVLGDVASNQKQSAHKLMNSSKKMQLYNSESKYVPGCTNSGPVKATMTVHFSDQKQCGGKINGKRIQIYNEKKIGELAQMQANAPSKKI